MPLRIKEFTVSVHYYSTSILQGLYPESHGIIDNNMYDVDMKSRFQLGKPAASDPRWWKGDPVRFHTVWGFEKRVAML